MGMIPLSEEIERLVQREVATARAATPTDFVEAAVLRMVEEAALFEEEIAAVAVAGIADIEAGRYVTVSSRTDLRAYLDGIMEEVRGDLADRS